MERSTSAGMGSGVSQDQQVHWVNLPGLGDPAQTSWTLISLLLRSLLTQLYEPNS